MAYGVLGSAVNAYMPSMSTDNIMQLVYLGLLILAIGGSALVAGRKNMGKMLQQAMIWALIFVGVIAAYGLWEDMSRNVGSQQAVVGEDTIAVARSRDGHFYLTLDINNEAIPFIIDTGASQVVLSQRDAERIGIDLASLNYVGSAMTANGIVQTAPVILDDVRLGNIADRNIPAVVNGGNMDASLLGMTYLGLYDRIEISNGQMVLNR